ncbi:hypothetical protein JOQ06_025469, partial [Pogonophryne albipinna]
MKEPDSAIETGFGALLCLESRWSTQCVRDLGAVQAFIVIRMESLGASWGSTALIKLVCVKVCFRSLLGETCVHVEVKRHPTETSFSSLWRWEK